MSPLAQAGQVVDERTGTQAAKMVTRKAISKNAWQRAVIANQGYSARPAGACGLCARRGMATVQVRLQCKRLAFFEKVAG